MTTQSLALEADRLVTEIDQALRRRYATALAWRQANPLRPVPAHLYSQLADYSEHVETVRRAATLTDIGKARVLRALLERVT